MTLPTPLQAFFLAQQWTSFDTDDTSSSEEEDQPKPLVDVFLIQDNARVNLSRNPLPKLQRRRSRLLASRWNSGTTIDPTIDRTTTTTATATHNPTKKPCHHRRGSPDEIDDALISALMDHCNKGVEEENRQPCTSNTDSPPQKPWRKQSRETVKQDQPPMSPSRKRESCSWPCAFGYTTIEDCPDLLHVEHHRAKRAPSAA